MTHNMTGTHGSSSADKKMGRAQDIYRGTDTERYQRRMGLWRDLLTSKKTAVKHRANKKRRNNSAKVIRSEIETDG